MPRDTLTGKERQLLLSNAVGILTTLREDGAPHATPTWVDVDGNTILINTASRLKQNSIRRDSRVCVTVVSGDSPMAYLTVEGRASLSSDGAWEHADRISHRYRGKAHPRSPDAERLIVRITPLRIQSTGVNDLRDDD